MPKCEKIPMKEYPGWVQIVETLDDNRRMLHHYEKDGYLVAFVPALGGWLAIDSNTSIFKFRDNAFKYADLLHDLDDINDQFLDEYETRKLNGFQ